MENYLLRTNLITRLDAIHIALKNALDNDTTENRLPYVTLNFDIHNLCYTIAVWYELL